ncbi:hypothetical protein NKH47_32735 [Mesorhizobium sp. M1060]|nr:MULTISPECIES: hypothetical protein [unclassified Mesorhizobium]WJI54190.1 hypothetical protein NLY44_05090 [Mesorhizobium sp. C089B]
MGLGAFGSLHRSGGARVASYALLVLSGACCVADHEFYPCC